MQKASENTKNFEENRQLFSQFRQEGQNTLQSYEEKESPNFIVSFGKFDEEVSLQQQLLSLAAANQIKTQAIAKADQMIVLLSEQKQSLKQEVFFLRQELNNKMYELDSLQARLETLQRQLSKTIQQKVSPSPSQKMETLTGSKLFFSFSQPQKIANAQYKSFSPSTLSVKPGLTISRELQPWSPHMGLFDQLKEAISEQQKDQAVLHEIEDAIKSEEMESDMLRWQLSRRMQVLQNCFEHDCSMDIEDYKSSSTYTQTERMSVYQEVVCQYQQIILEYRSYSGHLKVYLCESINALTKLAQFFQLYASDSKFVGIKFRDTLSQIVQLFKDKLSQNRQQNQELHFIIQSLITNLKKVKGQCWQEIIISNK